MQIEPPQREEQTQRKQLEIYSHFSKNTSAPNSELTLSRLVNFEPTHPP